MAEFSATKQTRARCGDADATTRGHAATPRDAHPRKTSRDARGDSRLRTARLRRRAHADAPTNDAPRRRCAIAHRRERQRDYRFRFTNSCSISSLLVITRELAWKPRCVTIMFVNSCARSTLDISSAPLVIVDWIPSSE